MLIMPHLERNISFPTWLCDYGFRDHTLLFKSSNGKGLEMADKHEETWSSSFPLH